MNQGDGDQPIFDFKAFVTQIAAARDVSFDEVMSRSRARHIAQARVDVYAALRARGWSLPHIGFRMKRDHTTIYYCLQKRAREAADRGDV